MSIQETQARVLADLTAVIVNVNIKLSMEEVQPCADADQMSDRIHAYTKAVEELRATRQNIENIFAQLAAVR